MSMCTIFRTVFSQPSYSGVPQECERHVVYRSPEASTTDVTGPVIGQSKSNLRLGFDRFAVASFDLQLADGAFSNFDVIAYLAEILRLDELSFGSGMAVEVPHFDNLLHARKWITVGDSHGTHEARLFAVQEIQGNGTVAVARFFVRFRANNEGGRSDKLAFVVLSRA